VIKKNYPGSIRFRITMAEVAFNKKRALLLAKWNGTVEETGKMIHLEHSFIWC
jgi:hypothetical protein